jgi:fatty acid desaturase
MWAPVGLRFHALHHLLPGLPYHALPEAHRRLMAALPPDSPYRRTNSPSLRASLTHLFRDARSESAGASEEQRD